MTSWSLRRLREIAKSATISIRSARQATKGVGTREQLVRVPIQHGYGSPSMIVKSLISCES